MDTFSCNSSAEKHVSFDHHADDDDQDQESGWTSYLEDFSNHCRGIDDRDHDHRMSSCWVLGGGASSSLVSDAATGRRGCHKVAGSSPVAGSVSFPNKLKFRKARNKEICEDDSLEDTASSPANSPKVSHLDEQIQAIPTKVDDYIGSNYVMGNGRVEDQRREGGGDVDNDGERSINNNFNDGKNDLRSRGLCLVPISMLVNYNP